MRGMKRSLRVLLTPCSTAVDFRTGTAECLYEKLVVVLIDYRSTLLLFNNSVLLSYYMYRFLRVAVFGYTTTCSYPVSTVAEYENETALFN